MSVRLETLSQLLPDGAPTRIDEKDEDAVRQGAMGLEALFLKNMLAEMRKTSEGGLLDGGYAGSVFRELLDETLADAMAQAGGIGIAEVIESELAGGHTLGDKRLPGPAGQTVANALKAYGAGSAEGAKLLHKTVEADRDGGR